MPLTKLNNKAVANVTSIPVALGDMVLVSSANASSSAYIEFTLGNYKEYQFYFVNIHPSTDAVDFEFNLSIDSGSNYNVTKTSTSFVAYHQENDTAAGVTYATAMDLAQSTAYQNITDEVGNGADESVSGSLTLFNPSSNVFVKHYISNVNNYYKGDAPNNHYIAGYANTVSPLTNIRFQMSSGNIDAGTILMYGIN